MLNFAYSPPQKHDSPLSSNINGVGQARKEGNAKAMQGKKYPAAFKARVALEAIRETRTVAELSLGIRGHSTMFSRWKREVLNQLTAIFSNRRGRKNQDNRELIVSLYQQSGHMKVELDWLKKICGSHTDENRN